MFEVNVCRLHLLKYCVTFLSKIALLSAKNRLKKLTSKGLKIWKFQQTLLYLISVRVVFCNKNANSQCSSKRKY